KTFSRKLGGENEKVALPWTTRSATTTQTRRSTSSIVRTTRTTTRSPPRTRSGTRRLSRSRPPPPRRRRARRRRPPRRRSDMPRTSEPFDKDLAVLVQDETSALHDSVAAVAQDVIDDQPPA